MLRPFRLGPAIVFAMFFVAGGARAAIIDVGTAIAITPTTFALPIEVTGAAGLSGWEFNLVFDPAFVQINTACDPLDPYCSFLTGPVTEGEFFAAGAPFNLLNPGIIVLDPGTFEQTGSLLAAQGAYGGPPPPPSGDGVLAYVNFVRIKPGGPGISVDSPSVIQVPEPASLLLLSTALPLLGRRRRRQRSPTCRPASR